MGTLFEIALRNLLQAKRRTFLLSSALALVSMFMIFLMALSQGLTDTMIRSATMLTAGHVNVAGFYKAKPGDSFPLVSHVGQIRQIIRDNVEGLDLILDRGRGFGKVISETASFQSAMAGIDVGEERILLERIQLAKESDYKSGGRDEVVGNPRDLSKPKTAMIFEGQAKRLGVSVGDMLTLTTESINGSVNTSEVRVIAVAKDVGFMSNWNIFVTKKTLRDLYQLNNDTTGAVMVFLKDPKRAHDVMSDLTKVLQKEGFRTMDYQPAPFWQKFTVVSGEDWVGQKLDLTIWEDEISYMNWTLTALESISFFLIAILLLIIVIGIMNTMWISVRERTQEIGTLRAIGMGRTRVMNLFLIEAGILGLFASSLGVGLGALLSWGLNQAHVIITAEAVRMVLMSDVLVLSVQGGALVRAIVTFSIVTMLAALWPALRASRLQPVTAIHRGA